MALPNNILQQVQTYQESNIAYLENLTCHVHLFNKKFKDFENLEANLGSTVTFDLPPQYTVANSLVATFQPSTQRVQNLTVDNAANVGYAFSAQQFIFNVEDYMDQFGKSAMMNLANKIEVNLALNAISACPVGDINGNPTGALHVESGPYRFYGNGTTPINSYQQLEQAITNFIDTGMVMEGIKVILPNTAIPAIIGGGLNQFAPKRNDEIAQSWQLGSFGTPSVEYLRSNLLPTQVAGTCGNSAQTLTVISVNDPTGQAVTQLTVSGATNNDVNAIKSGDLLQFNYNVSGQPNLNYLSFYGQATTSQPVQIRAIANAAADGSGHVVINITPALVWAPTAQQNINNPIAAGMQLSVLPTHKAGWIIGGNSAFLAMPRLPTQDPFYTSSETDMETGVSMRGYWGTVFGQNQQGWVHDCVWGSTAVPSYCMRLAFPPTT